MDSDALRQIKKSMREADDLELQRWVSIEQDNWRPEAVEVAREELRRRGIDELSVDEFRKRHFPGVGHDGFCETCRNETIDEPPGNTTRISGIGTDLLGRRDPCAVCGSVIQSKWFCLLNIPVIRLAQYRVVYLKKGLRSFLSTGYSAEYVGRKLR